jgi:phosphate transport system permease protein
VTADPFEAMVDPMVARRQLVQATASATLKRRLWTSRIQVGVCWTFLAVAIVPLLGVLAYVIIKGLPAWNADFFTQVTVPQGIEGGGVWNATIGTVLIGGIATAVSVPFGLGAGLFLSGSEGRFAYATRFTADVMTGVPSITIGIFGYIAIVRNDGEQYSGLAGAFAIGLIMLPVIIRASETAFRNVDPDLREAGLALGAHQVTLDRKITLPTALPGVITGVLLAVARGIGETAPLLLTIFGNQYLQWNPTKPMDALPLVIYNNSSQPSAQLVEVAWGAALLLMVFVFTLNIGSRLTAAFLGRERK